MKNSYRKMTALFVVILMMASMAVVPAFAKDSSDDSPVQGGDSNSGRGSGDDSRDDGRSGSSDDSRSRDDRAAGSFEDNADGDLIRGRGDENEIRGRENEIRGRDNENEIRGRDGEDEIRGRDNENEIRGRDNENEVGDIRGSDSRDDGRGARATHTSRERLEITSDSFDGFTEVKVKLDFATGSLTSEEIANDILERLDMDAAAIDRLLVMDDDMEELEERTKFRIKEDNGGMRVRFEMRFPLDTDDRSAIVEGIEARLARFTLTDVGPLVGAGARETRSRSIFDDLSERINGIFTRHDNESEIRGRDRAAFEDNADLIRGRGDENEIRGRENEIRGRDNESEIRGNDDSPEITVTRVRSRGILDSLSDMISGIFGSRHI